MSNIINEKILKIKNAAEKICEYVFDDKNINSKDIKNIKETYSNLNDALSIIILNDKITHRMFASKDKPLVDTKKLKLQIDKLKKIDFEIYSLVFSLTNTCVHEQYFTSVGDIRQKNLLNKQKDEIIETTSSQINKIKKQTTQITEESNKQIERVKNNIYTDFITILGIFTAITFAIFGGMNLLTDLFKNIGSTPVSLGQTLILAAIFSLIMWGIIELLFYWISKIKGTTKGTTNSTKDKNKKWFNWIAFIILTFLLIVGVWLFIL